VHLVDDADEALPGAFELDEVLRRRQRFDRFGRLLGRNLAAARDGSPRAGGEVQRDCEEERPFGGLVHVFEASGRDDERALNLVGELGGGHAAPAQRALDEPDVPVQQGSDTALTIAGSRRRRARRLGDGLPVIVATGGSALAGGDAWLGPGHDAPMAIVVTAVFLCSELTVAPNVGQPPANQR